MILKTSRQHGCDAQLLQDITNLNAQKADREKYIVDQQKKVKNIQINFEPNQEALNFAKSVRTLGKVETKGHMSRKMAQNHYRPSTC